MSRAAFRLKSLLVHLVEVAASLSQLFLGLGGPGELLRDTFLPLGPLQDFSAALLFLFLDDARVLLGSAAASLDWLDVTAPDVITGDAGLARVAFHIKDLVRDHGLGLVIQAARAGAAVIDPRFEA
jgi:hypothetical protein